MDVSVAPVCWPRLGLGGSRPLVASVGGAFGSLTGGRPQVSELAADGTVHHSPEEGRSVPRQKATDAPERGDGHGQEGDGHSKNSL